MSSQNKTKPTLWLSFDIEADGPSPLCNNMLSIGICGLDDNCVSHFEFEANFLPLDGHISDEKTMSYFWSNPENKNAYDRLQINQKSNFEIMSQLSENFEKLSKIVKNV